MYDRSLNKDDFLLEAHSSKKTNTKYSFAGLIFVILIQDNQVEFSSLTHRTGLWHLLGLCNTYTNI